MTVCSAPGNPRAGSQYGRYVKEEPFVLFLRREDWICRLHSEGFPMSRAQQGPSLLRPDVGDWSENVAYVLHLSIGGET
jgi:hypothetical protein